MPRLTKLPYILVSHFWKADGRKANSPVRDPNRQEPLPSYGFLPSEKPASSHPPPPFPGPALHARKRSALAIIVRSQRWVERGTAGRCPAGLVPGCRYCHDGCVGAEQGLVLLPALAGGLRESLQPVAADVFPVGAVAIRAKRGRQDWTPVPR